MCRRGVTMACGVLLGTALIPMPPVDAHHSIAGAYDTRREVRIEGVVTAFEFVNPHAFLTVEVRATGGATQRWRVELDDRGELSEIGMTAQTLAPGHQVIVVGSPARREAYRMYLGRLDRPADGYSFEQVGGRPTLRTRPR